MNNIYDVGIIGIGVAGAFACYKIAKEYKNLKVIGFDIGRPPQKRRRQIEGYLGCLPNSDGKLYLNDINKVSELIGAKKTKAAHAEFDEIIAKINNFKTVKDKPLSATVDKKLKKFGYDSYANDYIQMYPKDIHLLSKYLSEGNQNSNNMKFNFDEEVQSIHKQNDIFTINTFEGNEFKCKKLIIAVGRSGWRWSKELYSNFGIIDNNDIARFGIRVECNSNIMKDFSKSNCTILKGSELEIGPLSWFGTVIPEDHVDLAISAFRSNENRWKSEKVSFSVIGNRLFPKKGFEQTDRIGKLTFVLANDRIIKEKISFITAGKSKISIIPEYDWLKETINDLSNIIPDISKAYFHVPTISPLPPKINIGANLESEIEGMFIIGESAGVSGILSAAIMGLHVVNEIAK